MGRAGHLALAGILIVSAGCDSKKPAPALTATPPQASEPTAWQAPVAAIEDPAPPSIMKPAPELAQLRKAVAALLPELRAHIQAGRTKRRGSTAACVQDLRKRLDWTNQTEDAVIVGNAFWIPGDAQRDLADALSSTLGRLRACVNCAPDDAPQCDKATERLRKLEAELAKR